MVEVDTRRSISWLPAHQEHVLYTLAHVDDLIDQAGSILRDYLEPGPFQFRTVRSGAHSSVVISDVRPIPEAVPRYVADALTQMRAAIEHTLFAQVEFDLGRPLSAREAKSIEMPALVLEVDFDRWLSSRGRASLHPFQSAAVLSKRLRGLQPFQRRDAELHPLRLLATHTNHCKHQRPSISTVHVGAVQPDDASTFSLPTEPTEPARVGDVIATGPANIRIDYSIWPKVTMQRPHTGTWHVVMNELASIEQWVREVAIPHLILGDSTVPAIPPHLPTNVGYRNIREAMANSSPLTAAKKSENSIVATTLRPDLAAMIHNQCDIDAGAALNWLGTISNESIVDIAELLQAASSAKDIHALQRIFDRLGDRIRHSASTF